MEAGFPNGDGLDMYRRGRMIMGRKMLRLELQRNRRSGGETKDMYRYSRCIKVMASQEKWQIFFMLIINMV